MYRLSIYTSAQYAAQYVTPAAQWRSSAVRRCGATRCADRGGRRRSGKEREGWGEECGPNDAVYRVAVEAQVAVVVADGVKAVQNHVGRQRRRGVSAAAPGAASASVSQRVSQRVSKRVSRRAREDWCGFKSEEYRVRVKGTNTQNSSPEQQTRSKPADQVPHLTAAWVFA